MLYKIKLKNTTLKLYQTPDDYLKDMQLYYEIINYSYLKDQINDCCECLYLNLESENNFIVLLDEIEMNWAFHNNIHKDKLYKVLINKKIGWVHENLIEKV